MFYCARVNKLQPVYIFDCYVGPKAAAGTLSEDVRVVRSGEGTFPYRLLVPDYCRRR